MPVVHGRLILNTHFQVIYRKIQEFLRLFDCDCPCLKGPISGRLYLKLFK
jgi:hypothetical protein